MLLSNYILNTGVKPYLEYGWVTAPNTAGQAITANTITTLTIDTEVADTGNNGSISGNQITLAAGTYYFNATTTSQSTGTEYPAGSFGLYNVTDSLYVTRRARVFLQLNSGNFELEGQFTISTSKIFDLRIWTNVTGFVIASGNYSIFSSLTTAGADQRTTIKLWKLA